MLERNGNQETTALTHCTLATSKTTLSCSTTPVCGGGTKKKQPSLLKKPKSSLFDAACLSADELGEGRDVWCGSGVSFYQVHFSSTDIIKPLKSDVKDDLSFSPP